MKPVKYQYINDAGWKNYAQSIATKPENITKYADCFKKLVPIIQQSTRRLPQRPDARQRDHPRRRRRSSTTAGCYTQGTADYAVKTMKDDGLVANGPDGVVGKFDDARGSPT